jgi:hypothetical protein
MEKNKLDVLNILKICFAVIMIFFCIKIINIINKFLKDPVANGFGLATKVLQQLADDIKSCKKGLLSGTCLLGLSFLFYVFGRPLFGLLGSVVRGRWGKTATADAIELRTGESAVKVLQEMIDENNDLQKTFENEDNLNKWKDGFAEKLSGKPKGSDEFSEARDKIDKLSDNQVRQIIKSDATSRRIANKIISKQGNGAIQSARNIVKSFTDWTGKLYSKNGIDPDDGKDAAGTTDIPELPQPIPEG